MSSKTAICMKISFYLKLIIAFVILVYPHFFSYSNLNLCSHSVFPVLPLKSFRLLVSAAMLCPVLLCATLLLLTPLEITEARALHPSPDAVQVWRGRRGRCDGGG